MASTKITTPRGTAVRPQIDRAYKWDQDANKSVPDPTGEFSLKLALAESEAAPLRAQIDQFAKDAGLKKPKNLPYAPEVDYKTEEETGRTLFTFKQYGQDSRGNARLIPQVDAKGKPLPKSFQLTAGSEIRVQAHPYAYKPLGGGVKLYLDGVQVIKYVERNTVSFDVVDDGFEYVEDETDSVSTEEDNGLAQADF